MKRNMHPNSLANLKRGHAVGTKLKEINTASLRDFVQLLIDDNRAQIYEDIKSLPPKERLAVMVRLLDFTLPKIATIQTADNQSKKITFEISGPEGTQDVDFEELRQDD